MVELVGEKGDEANGPLKQGDPDWAYQHRYKSGGRRLIDARTGEEREGTGR